VGIRRSGLRFYEMAAGGDPAALEVFHPDAEFAMPESLPHGGTIVGREALAAYFRDVHARREDFRAELDDCVDGGERVVALGRFCGRPRVSGRYVEITFALVWTFRDAAAVRVDEYTDTPCCSRRSPGGLSHRRHLAGRSNASRHQVAQADRKPHGLAVGDRGGTRIVRIRTVRVADV